MIRASIEFAFIVPKNVIVLSMLFLSRLLQVYWLLTAVSRLQKPDFEC